MAGPLPIPDETALAHSRRLVELIRGKIEESGGWIDFATYMQLALYSPGLGYYTGGANKFGGAGDFVTAPEISPLFGRTLAHQAAQVLRETSGDLLELGAGTGKLCLHLLQELDEIGALPQRYLILEVSAQLREIQRQTLMQALPAGLLQRVEWIDELPEMFIGLVLGNEVLDALPVHIVANENGKMVELGIALEGDKLAWRRHAITSEELGERAEQLQLPSGYQTEICTAAGGLIASLCRMLQRGVILFIDYGFPRNEYYHAQRSEGTLMCHYRHHVHGDPFLYPGLQDITAHVDFTAAAEAGVAYGLRLLGYCSQAQFLVNCGITELLKQSEPENMASYAPAAATAQKLLSPAEMGELFKAIALGKGYSGELMGFAQGNKIHRL